MNNYFGTYKRNSKLLFGVVAIVFILLFIFSFNMQAYGEGSIIWPLIVLPIGIAALYFLIVQSNKATSEEQLAAHIKQIVDTEKTQILAGFEEDKKNETEEEESEEDRISRQVKAILPTRARSTDGFCKSLLTNLGKELQLVTGIIYLRESDGETYQSNTTYGIELETKPSFSTGDSLTSQAAQLQQIITVDEIPADYFQVASGLGDAPPTAILFIPIIDANNTIALLEIGFFSKPDATENKILETLAEQISKPLLNLLNKA